MTTNDADVLALANLPNADGRPLPRRCYTDLFCPAETAIKDAMWAVERMAGSPGLTDALNLLEQAKKRVADYVDGVEGERDKLLGDARFYAKKMREDSADGKTVRVPLSVARVLEDCARALSRPVPEGWRPIKEFDQSDDGVWALLLEEDGYQRAWVTWRDGEFFEFCCSTRLRPLTDFKAAYFLIPPAAPSEREDR
jgi:hypothetical protein